MTTFGDFCVMCSFFELIRARVIKVWKNQLNLLQMDVIYCIYGCYIAVDFLKLMLFAVDLFADKLGFLCIWWQFCSVEEEEGEWSSRKIRGWDSRVPLVEFQSSSAGSREFHCWKSRVPLLELNFAASNNSNTKTRRRKEIISRWQWRS